MTIHRDEPENLSDQLAEILRDQLDSGALPPRRKLPTQARPSDTYHVSRGTVLKATNLLVDEGLIRFIPGRGLFSAEPSTIAAWKKKHAAQRRR